MLVKISLVNRHPIFTNLDEVSGLVNLSVPTASSISSIVVKLEGESKTRLMASNRQGTKVKPLLEIHKILYKILVVYPPDGQKEDAAQPNILSPGNYEFPFRFKIPFNNTCSIANNPISGFMNIPIELPAFSHVKKTLPPTLTGFPGEAEISYFVKVTVNRPQIFKENPRAIAGFKFMPIEPPRPGEFDGEAYARREPIFASEFPSVNPPPPPTSQGEKFLGDEKDGLPTATAAPAAATESTASSVTAATPNLEPPRVSVDARLPNPSILTCNEDLPVRIVVKQLKASTASVFIDDLQLELISYTRIRAQDTKRTESNSWVIVSLTGLGIRVSEPGDSAGTETVVNDAFWEGRPLPNSVAPSFETCNLSRHYELEVRVGLSYAFSGGKKSSIIVLPLRLPVKLYSGIAPPPALISGMASEPLAKPQRPTSISHIGSDGPNTTLLQPASAASGSIAPRRASAPWPGPPPINDEPPPSYADAMAQNIGPVDGPRRSYVQPPQSETDNFGGENPR